MTLVRVYQPAGAPVRICVPSTSVVERFETEAEALAYAAERTEEVDPTLAGLPYADLDTADLPPDRGRRNDWRLVDGAVVVVEA